ncbi:hypothetical protein KSS87_017186 [Heliosperma pusillum]|nr:hypothetical protein KSS87_017186 [Heliosperma pusillum]
MEGVQDHKYMISLYHKEHQKFINIGKVDEHEKDMNNNVNSDNESISSTTLSSSSSFQDSNISNESSSSSDLLDDASSSSSSPNGPLFALSDLMDQLPINKVFYLNQGRIKGAAGRMGHFFVAQLVRRSVRCHPGARLVLQILRPGLVRS